MSATKHLPALTGPDEQVSGEIYLADSIRAYLQWSTRSATWSTPSEA
jgi:hypothetical protein